ncbi:hypothetical protein FBR04_09200 [Betaproteobacteria bacterium PRO7]|jgi:hypothetical protein|nr:hypothetical protein [Betaproteobacteria bacterium PRO7]GIL05661.1 MAG: hypothetical protein BroJett031_21810 [Betaproteobacteria bacterium]
MSTTTTTRITFRRVVLSLASGDAPGPALEAAAALARWLDAELLALFVENAALYDYARLPFAREIGPGAAWRPLAPERLLDDYLAMAAAAQRRLRAIAARAGVPCEFEILRGDPAASLARTAADDLLALLEPADPLARWLPPREVPAAGQLILPRRLRRTRGPVVVVVTRPDEAAQTIAARIAAAAGEELIALEAERDAAQGLPANARRTRCAPTARAAAVALQARRERLLVVPRSVLSMSKAGILTPDHVRGQGRTDEAALADWTRLAAEHGVPLLVVDGA